MQTTKNMTMEDCFKLFLSVTAAKGVKDKTLETYRNHFKSISKRLNTIPDSVTTIGDYAFHYCDSLTSVTIPDSVTTIRKFVFFGCDSLTTVTIPDSVTIIGDSAFYWCDSLTDVYFEGSRTQWEAINIGESNGPLINATIHFAVTD